MHQQRNQGTYEIGAFEVFPEDAVTNCAEKVTVSTSMALDEKPK